MRVRTEGQKKRRRGKKKGKKMERKKNKCLEDK
jgi:hypothetical protein